MTNDKENEREFEINLDFLKDGRTYRVTSFEDGINAGYQAMDYRMKSATMNKNQKLSVKMARKWWVCSCSRISLYCRNQDISHKKETASIKK